MSAVVLVVTADRRRWWCSSRHSGCIFLFAFKMKPEAYGWCSTFSLSLCMCVVLVVVVVVGFYNLCSMSRAGCPTQCVAALFSRGMQSQTCKSKITAYNCFTHIKVTLVLEWTGLFCFDCFFLSQMELHSCFKVEKMHLAGYGCQYCLCLLLFFIFVPSHLNRRT